MLQIDSQVLKRVVSSLASAFDKGGLSSPSSRNILFKDGKAILSGKNKTIECDCEFNEPANFVAPYEELSKVVAFGEPTKSFRIKPRDIGGCHIGYGDWKWLLVCEPESDWVDLCPAENKKTLPAMRMTIDEFIRGVRSVLFARARINDPRVPLDSVLFQIIDGEVFFVATDGRRCAVFMTEIDQAVDDTDVLIDGKTLESVVSVASKQDDNDAVQLLYSENRLIFEFQSTVVRTIRPVFSYPDWRKLFPKNMTEPEDFGSTASEIGAAIERVSICCGDDSHGVNIAADAGVLTVDAKGLGKSAAQVQLTKSTKRSDAIINPSFLTDWLGTLEGCEPVHFSLGEQGTSDHAMFASDGRRYLVCRIDKS